MKIRFIILAVLSVFVFTGCNSVSDVTTTAPVLPTNAADSIDDTVTEIDPAPLTAVNTIVIGKGQNPFRITNGTYCLTDDKGNSDIRFDVAEADNIDATFSDSGMYMGPKIGSKSCGFLYVIYVKNIVSVNIEASGFDGETIITACIYDKSGKYIGNNRVENSSLYLKASDNTGEKLSVMFINRPYSVQIINSITITYIDDAPTVTDIPIIDN